jgi:protoporphyrinogen/coproporphyrinogen III oxidase
MPPPIQVAIVGAGISGLSCAHRLRQLGLSVVVLESQSHSGGVVGTIERNGFRIETGPQSFLGTKPILELTRELGIENEILQANPSAPRFVYKRGRLHAVPMSPPAVLTSSLLSFASRLRIISEPLRRTAPPQSDESVAAFVRRKFGHEILEYLVAPFVSGVYAGDPEILSLKSAFPSLDEWERQHGSVIRGAMNARKSTPGPRPGLCTFRGGMKTLMESLNRSVDIEFVPGARVEAIEKSAAGAGFTVRFTRGERHEVLSVPAVVVAAPAYISGHMLSDLSPNLAKILEGIAYAPVAVVTLAYKRLQVTNSLIGFGVLFPRKEGFRTLGTVWNSSLFPECAPADSVLLTSFVGGATDSEIVKEDDAKISAIVEKEISGILNIGGAPVEKQIWRHEKGLPQYNLGHSYTLENAKEELKKFPGLFMIGNYWIGPSIGNCVEASNIAAASAQTFLAGRLG